MNLFKPAVFLFLVFGLGTGLFAQEALDGTNMVPPETSEVPSEIPSETPPDGGTFLPYVSGLRGEVKNNLVRLSWLDSPHVKGPVYIYRSPTSFHEYPAPFPGRPRQVPYGAESYIDEIDDSGTYHYLVIATGEEGQRYESFILEGNTASVEVTGSIGAARETLAARAAEETVESSHGVSGLAAQADSEKITVSFRAEADADILILYRSIRPIRNTPDLLSAAIIQSNVKSPVVDFPVPGIPYYYALVPGGKLTDGTVMIRPGINATVDPAEVVVDSRPAGIRTVPLPLISPAGAMAGIPLEEVPLPGELPPDIKKALGDIPVREKDPVKPMDKRIFPEDLEIAGGGEAYLLGSIVQGPFSNAQWELALDELARFVSLPRDRLVEARARYYLGQCLYFAGVPREALFEFLEVRSVFPNESAEWIRAILQTLAE